MYTHKSVRNYNIKGDVKFQIVPNNSYSGLKVAIGSKTDLSNKKSFFFKIAWVSIFSKYILGVFKPCFTLGSGRVSYDIYIFLDKSVLDPMATF